MGPPPVWDGLRCLRCVACVGCCPVGAMAFRSNSILVDAMVCTGCMRCVLFCPEGCLEEVRG